METSNTTNKKQVILALCHVMLERALMMCSSDIWFDFHKNQNIFGIVQIFFK